MKQPGRKYSKEFKEEAVTLANGQGYSIAEAATRLGINAEMLAGWKQQQEIEKANAFPGNGNQAPWAREIQSLRAVLRRAEMACDILKKPGRAGDGLLCQGVPLRHHFIKTHAKTWPVTILCFVLKVSRRGLYEWRRRPESDQKKQNQQLSLAIRVIHRKSRETYGSPRVYQALRRELIDNKFALHRRTSRKRLRAKIKDVREKLLRNRHREVADMGKWLKAVVQGHLNYFAVPGNRWACNSLRTQFIPGGMNALRKRGQKARKKANWSRRGALIRRWIPSVNLTHWYPMLVEGRITQNRSRMP